jgi:type IV pilus biogenesis protein PilP
MDRIVARAAQAQQRAATQVAAAAPRAVAPSGPTGGTVAQTATLEGAINLREINLIGIYGGSGDRRALVRLGNGRYQRVTVGDNLDGGRVSAISANALSYTKRGRSITLQVPG